MPNPPVSTQVPARHWHPLDNGLIQCDLCPRYCQLHEGQRGFCFVRQRENNQLWLTTYGRASGYCIDPIEKKPLNHFYPGTPILSFGTAGCNLACKFCQNADISKARKMDALQQAIPLHTLAQASKQLGAKSIAYTYNDPVIFHEFAIDMAQAAKAEGLLNVAVTAGYVCAAPRAEFYQWMDAANIDLKAFNPQFYKKLTGADLDKVLETIDYVVNETQTWVELTTLLIPGENDSEQEIRQMCQWLMDHGCEHTPLHFSAFHPDYRMTDKPRTPTQTLLNARRWAQDCGLRNVFTGNVNHPPSQSSYCPNCGNIVIERHHYSLGQWQLDVDPQTHQAQCRHCQHPIAGHFDPTPGQWGNQRQPVRFNHRL